eukprot:TRINITY_DN5380_c0_g1_i1.p1 TRINITY_DN5380_c0_g1~~TRINITY_DN5380_c0_g1_i1.p1  ORF type:complete len:377 (-),score=49.90 TRINITY_DN5380_c0_g1_i1:114-1244(-)
MLKTVNQLIKHSITQAKYRERYFVETTQKSSTGDLSIIIDKNGNISHSPTVEIVKGGFIWEDKVPKHFWKSRENRMKYLIWLQKVLNINNVDSLYKLSSQDIINNHGAGIMKHYQNSPIKLLMDLIPDNTWKPYLFSRVPHKYWTTRENHLEFVKYLEEKLGIVDSKDGWYCVSVKDIEKYGGRYFLQYYDYSIQKMITTLYPEYGWNTLLFNKSDLIDWNNPELVREYLDIIAKKLHIQQPEEWYRISQNQLKHIGLGKILKHFRTLGYALQFAYPDYTWNHKLFQVKKTKKSSQRWLVKCIETLFPDHLVLEEFFNPEIKISVDVWIPSLSLAFEYHGIHHYHDVSSFSGTVDIYQNRYITLHLSPQFGGTVHA